MKHYSMIHQCLECVRIHLLGGGGGGGRSSLEVLVRGGGVIISLREGEGEEWRNVILKTFKSCTRLEFSS